MWTPDPGTGFKVLPQWISHFKSSVFRDSRFLNQDSGLQKVGFHKQIFPGFQIPQANVSWIPDSTSKCFLDSGIQITLYGASSKSLGAYINFMVKLQIIQNGKMLVFWNNCHIKCFIKFHSLKTTCYGHLKMVSGTWANQTAETTNPRENQTFETTKPRHYRE